MNRRSRNRFPSLAMRTRVRRPNNLLAQWAEVTAVDFNKEGMAFVSEEEFEIGETLLLRMSVTMTHSQIEADKVIAVVRSRKKQGPASRYGVQFSFEASRLMRSVTLQATLGRIEGIMDRSLKQQLRTRLPESYPSQ